MTTQSTPQWVIYLYGSYDASVIGPFASSQDASFWGTANLDSIEGQPLDWEVFEQSSPESWLEADKG